MGQAVLIGAAPARQLTPPSSMWPRHYVVRMGQMGLKTKSAIRAEADSLKQCPFQFFNGHPSHLLGLLVTQKFKQSLQAEVSGSNKFPDQSLWVHHLTPVITPRPAPADHPFHCWPSLTALQVGRFWLFGPAGNGCWAAEVW